MSSDDEPFVSIDILEDIFSQTAGSIRGAAGIVLWCWTVYSTMSLDPWTQSPLTFLALAWFMCVALARSAMELNRWLVSGSRWRLDPKTDVIAITGGSSGLGLVLVALFGSAGFRVVNLDVAEPQIDIANAHFYKCSVSDPARLAAVLAELSDADLVPTVLVNCAGTVAESMQPVSRLPLQSIQSVIDTNLVGAIQTTAAVLQANAALKMVVAISSSTALVGPAYSGVYAASKAGLRTFFESLRQELKYKRQTRVLTVTPGQLDTAMFQHVKTPSAFWAPTLKAVDVATVIHDAIVSGRQGEISMPAYSRLMPYMLCLPQGIIDLLRLFIGVDTAARPTAYITADSTAHSTAHSTERSTERSTAHAS